VALLLAVVAGDLGEVTGLASRGVLALAVGAVALEGDMGLGRGTVGAKAAAAAAIGLAGSIT
jgi:hypothetical protein